MRGVGSDRGRGAVRGGGWRVEGTDTCAERVKAAVKEHLAVDNS